MYSKTKSQQTFFVETDKPLLWLVWKYKGPWIARTTLKSNEMGGLTLPDFKTYYKATEIKGA